MKHRFADEITMVRVTIPLGPAVIANILHPRTALSRPTSFSSPIFGEAVVEGIVSMPYTWRTGALIRSIGNQGLTQRDTFMTLEIIIQAIISGLLMGFVYALIAAGLSLIFGLMEIVNFAHGEFMMLGMYAAFWLWSLFGLDPLVSLPICAALLFCLGVATHYGIIRHILNASMLVQICATFGLAIFLRASAQFLWTPDFRTISHPIVEGRVEIMGIFIKS